MESFYASLAEADKDWAITRGWIPDFLPASSRTIHEVHDLSPSKEWCAFEFLPSDSQILRKKLNRFEALPSSVRRVPSPGVAWWPAILKGDLDVEKIRGVGLDLEIVKMPETSVSTQILLFAVDWAKGRAFFYSTRESTGAP
jgi:hypothetical protein